VVLLTTENVMMVGMDPSTTFADAEKTAWIAEDVVRTPPPAMTGRTATGTVNQKCARR